MIKSNSKISPKISIFVPQEFWPKKIQKIEKKMYRRWLAPGTRKTPASQIAPPNMTSQQKIHFRKIEIPHKIAQLWNFWNQNRTFRRWRRRAERACGSGPAYFPRLNPPFFSSKNNISFLVIWNNFQRKLVNITDYNFYFNLRNLVFNVQTLQAQFARL